MKGKLYGIGTGPGDPELLTIRAIKAIEKCGVIAVPVTGREKAAFSIIKQYADGKQILECPFSMDKNIEKRKLSRIAAAESIMRELETGKDVSFITLGDPTTYSTYMYVHEIIVERGFLAEIIPGITSYAAAAAELGVALCEGNEPLLVIPSGSGADIDKLLNFNGNKVIMKAGANLPRVLNKLKSLGYGRNTKIACRVTMEGQELYHTIEECEMSKENGYFTVVIVN